MVKYIAEQVIVDLSVLPFCKYLFTFFKICEYLRFRVLDLGALIKYG